MVPGLNQILFSLQLIDFWPGLRVWRSVYFLGHVLILAIMAAGVVFPPPTQKKRTTPPTSAPSNIPVAPHNGSKKAE